MLCPSDMQGSVGCLGEAASSEKGIDKYSVSKRVLGAMVLVQSVCLYWVPFPK